MADHYPQCEVCVSPFDSEDHKPLMLPCGHAFCRSCLDALEDNGTDSCPSCRSVYEEDVDDLPVCYTLIPKDVPLNVRVREESCSQHKFPFLYWCKKCKRVVCKQCALDAHNGHKLLLKEEAVKEEAKCSEPRETLISELTTKKTLVTSLMTACDDHLADLTEMIARVETQRDHLAKKRCQIEKDLDTLQRKRPLRVISPEEKNWDMLMLTSRAFEPPELVDHLVFIKNILQRRVLKMIQEIDTSGLKCLPSDMKYMKNNEEWVIRNEETAQSAVLTIWMTNNKPSSALVRDAPHETIPFLDVFLRSLVMVCNRIDLQLLSSFWQTYYGQVHVDDSLLAPLLEGKSSKLRTFFGRISEELVAKLCCRKLFCLGLRVDRASDVSIVNAVADTCCYSLHIAICEQVGRASLGPIAPRLVSKCCIFLHFVELNDGDLPWMMQVIDALLPEEPNTHKNYHDSTNRIAGLYLINCHFTTIEAAKLLTWIHETRLTASVWYQTSSHDDFSKKILEERAVTCKVQLSWNAVLPRAPRVAR